MSTIILQGDAAHLPLPDEAVDLVVTSPPYFGLRSYTDGGEHIPEQVGAETTPAEYLDTLVACTAEWIRVLKPGGSIFVNLGDKYASYEGNRTGTTAMVADVLGRVGITVDLSYDYCRIARWRTADEKQRARVVAPRPKAPVVQLPASQTDDSTDEEESA